MVPGDVSKCYPDTPEGQARYALALIRRPKSVPCISPFDTLLILFIQLTISPCGQQGRYYFLMLCGVHWMLEAKWLPKTMQLISLRQG